MSRRKRNAQLFREATDAWNRRDVEAVLEFLHPSVETHVAVALANTGTWHGIEGFGEMAAGWEEVWGELNYEVVATETPDDSHVIAEVHQTATGVHSGVPVELTTFYLAEISEDERALRLHIYPDRESAVAAISTPD
jgi:hypothetical protein